MELLYGSLAALFILSLAVNAYLFILLRKSAKTRPESYEVKDLLRDLMAGRGLIEIKRIAPESFFIRSPRESQ